MEPEPPKPWLKRLLQRLTRRNHQKPIPAHKLALKLLAQPPANQATPTTVNTRGTVIRVTGHHTAVIGHHDRRLPQLSCRFRNDQVTRQLAPGDQVTISAQPHHTHAQAYAKLNNAVVQSRVPAKHAIA